MAKEYEVRITMADPVLLFHMLEVCDIKVRLAVTCEEAMGPFEMGCQATQALCALNKSDSLSTWEFEVE